MRCLAPVKLVFHAPPPSQTESSGIKLGRKGLEAFDPLTDSGWGGGAEGGGEGVVGHKKASEF
jgi:hypothetical protein